MCKLLALLMLASTIAAGQTSDDVTRWLGEARRGDAKAANWLGVAYERGKGVHQDLTKAVAWYWRAATQGNANAQNRLGQIYEDGLIVRRDLVRAAAWYRLACEHRPDYGGAGQGCNNLALLYEQGLGVPLDKVQAYKYFKLGPIRSTPAELVSKMTLDEVTEAERQLANWHEAHPDN